MDNKDHFVDKWKEEKLNPEKVERPLCHHEHPTMGWQCELYANHEDPNHYFDGAQWVNCEHPNYKK